MANIAIVGAGGLVGRKLIDVLANKLPEHKLRLYGNASAGQKVQALGKNYVIEHSDRLQEAEIDYAMFMAGADVSQRLIPPLAEKGVTCIDNSSAFRMDPSVPLVVTQINGRAVLGKKIISNPNCTTIQVVMALHALAELGLRGVTVATYQAASGAGREGLEDLQEKRSYGKLKCFSHPIYDNLIAQIGAIEADGTTVEEMKMRNECRKILDMPDLAVNSFCVRVPVSVGHGAFVNVKTASKIDFNQARRLLKGAKNILLFDDAERGLYPMPSLLRQTHFVGVGRISSDGTDNGLNMFVVADNLLRGAAYNAYEILQVAMNNGDTL